ncbi:MAG: putative Ig domain-containing protein, partial [Candidatus Poseidoniaceae archaeon]|nr:putative Ig domain-containing protein [Candidatus Poseidoniaceae archaeon]
LSKTGEFTIVVNDYAPVPLNYFGNDLTLTKGQTMTPIGDFELKPDVIAAGEDHTCAIQGDDGTVRCWGKGGYGRLGIGSTSDKTTPKLTNSLGSGRTAIDITAGQQHTCAVLDDGSIVCWGRNNYGQLGDNTTDMRSSPTQTVPLPRPAVAVEAGQEFTCALMDNGSVMCWGRGTSGRLGIGGSGAFVPTFTNPIPGGRKAVAIDISHWHTCAVLEDGYVACWGEGDNRRLGQGASSTDQSSPIIINYFNETNRAIDVALNNYGGCGLMENGSVTCWGQGYLGSGASTIKDSPGLVFAALGSGRTAVEVEMGRFHACVKLDNGAVKCWGDDQYGQMGNGNGRSNQNNPTQVTFASGIEAQSVYAGWWHTCITAQTNEIYCWGDGNDGKLGDGGIGQHNFAGSQAKVNHYSGTNPVRTFGSITAWTVSPTLPLGLSIDSSTGEISGTPTVASFTKAYTVTASNSGGNSTTTVKILVYDEAPSFSYSPNSFNLTKDTLMSPTATPTNTGGAIPSGVVDTSGTVGEYNSIAIDSNGYRHISYYDSSNDDLKYATDKSGSWVLTPVDSTSASVGKFTSIVIDSNDDVHISYHDSSNDDLKYATDKSGSWVVSSVDTPGNVGEYTSIAVDSVDDVHISYWDTSNNDMKYATNKSGLWVPTSVDSTASVGKFTSIVIDSNDDVHISYYDSSDKDLKYATKKSGFWVLTSVDTSGDVGKHPSIAVDSNNYVHISYYNDSNNDLKYTTCSSSSCSTASSWSNTSIDTPGGVGQYPSIAVDSDNHVHISYWDDPNNDLKYATCSSSCLTESSWSSTSIAGNVGKHSSIAIDSNDDVHISYNDSSNSDLKYISLDSSSNVYGYSV